MDDYFAGLIIVSVPVTCVERGQLRRTAGVVGSSCESADVVGRRGDSWPVTSSVPRWTCDRKDVSRARPALTLRVYAVLVV